VPSFTAHAATLLPHLGISRMRLNGSTVLW